MSTLRNKKNALLGGLLVFVIPTILISTLYFTASRLPKGKEIPLLQKAETVEDWVFLHTSDQKADTIQKGTFWKDIKIVFHVDSTNWEERSSLLQKLTDRTKTDPEFSLKEPYGQLYFFAISDQKFPDLENLHHWFVVNEIENSSAFQDKNRLVLLDRNENIRGSYSYSKEGIAELDRDTQYLLQDTFFENADTLRIKKLFKTQIDEE